MKVLERDVERYLVRRVEEAGGKAYKFTSPNNAGVPDRLLLLPGRVCAFAELKAPGQHMRPLQVKQAERIEALGFPVMCLDSKEKIDEAVRALLQGGALFGYGWRGYDQGHH